MVRPKALYKFTTTGRADVLEAGFIRFTQPGALNDPFELQPLFEHLLTEAQLQGAARPPFEMVEEALHRRHSELPPAQQEQFPAEVLAEILRANPLVLERLTAGVVPTLRKVVADFAPRARRMLAEALQARVGILSLSEDLKNPLLWAHYADSHKGLAIELDSEHGYFNRRRSETDEFYHLRKVRYANRTAKGRTLLDLDGDDLLVTKAKAWEYEAEWRMLAPLEDATRVLNSGEDAIYLFALPTAAISRVVLGAKASRDLCQRVARALALPGREHICLMQAGIDSIDQSISITVAPATHAIAEQE